MAVRQFVDTNVAVYACDASDPQKQNIARQLFAEHADLVLSAQVLGEFYVVVTRKLAHPLDEADAQRAVDALAAMPTVVVDLVLVREAVELSRSEQISYWDALIVVAAASAGCKVLLTEDLADGAVIRGVAVHNPFGAS